MESVAKFDFFRTLDIISAEHRSKIEKYVEIGLQEGAKLETGGKRPEDPELANGFFYLPTIFSGCTSDMRIVQEEVFGPVLSSHAQFGSDAFRFFDVF